ncbi:unnamed protein product [Aphanomyces euteiches]
MAPGVRTITHGETSCICGISLTERDATFAVSDESRVRIYSASELVLLHEFSSIHGRILDMHHTTFCDAIVTLETHGADDDDGDCYLCVYHDWRSSNTPSPSQNLVRAYTLPLAIARPESVCLSVCSFTGRVALATADGFGVNIWQTSDGFFEHVMELKVDRDFQYVSVHGAYVAIASRTEVRVMEIIVEPASSTSGRKSNGGDVKPKLLERKKELIYNTLEKDRIPKIRIPSVSGISTAVAHEAVVQVMGKDDAQLEAYNLAGLVHDQDIRVNAALEYVHSRVQVLLQRFVPPNHVISALRFLPETVDPSRVAQSRTYARLLVSTATESFLYYFIADEVDATRDLMAKKILRREADPIRGVIEPIAITNGTSNAGFTESTSALETRSGRVAMMYKFSAPVNCVTANSSFLFAATLAGLEVWSLWSPCHHIAAKKALDSTFALQPTQPQLLGVHPLPNEPVAKNIVALDSYVAVLLQASLTEESHPLKNSSAVARRKAHALPFEMRRHQAQVKMADGIVVVFPQSPPSTMFEKAKVETSGNHVVTKDQMDLLLSLFSLYRFRADVGLHALHDMSGLTKETLALQFEISLYDSLARACAAHIAHLYTTPAFRNLTRAALLYVASNVPSRDVLVKFRSVEKANDPTDVIDATAVYLEAFLFPQKDPANYLGLHLPVERDDDNDVSFTGVVLRHYGDHAPEQLSRLAIDSSLTWTLLDIDYCLAKLRFAEHKSVLIRIGILVLLIRATGLPDLESFVQAKHAVLPADDEYSDASISNRIEWLAENYPEPLIHLCVTHPEFLIQKHRRADDEDTVAVPPMFYRSILATGLLAKAPTKLLSALELIFYSALGHQNAFLTAMSFCLGVLGGGDAASRIRSGHSNISAAQPLETSEVYVLGAMHFMLLHMSKYPGGDTTIQASLALEYIHVCIRLSLVSSPNAKAMLTHALASRSSLLPKKQTPVPSFVEPYLDATAGLAKNSHIDQTLHQLYLFACQLVPTVDAATLATLCAFYKDAGPIPTLMELLILPRVDRLEDGLRKIYGNPLYYGYLVGYATAFCHSLEEWKTFLHIVLDSTSPLSSELLSTVQDTLDHLALTFTPQEFLMLLRDACENTK